MDEPKILIFGKERYTSRTFSWVLENKGYLVKLAPNPATALAWLIEEDFDLIIVRLNMEDLQVLDVLQRAKKLNPEICIVVVSVDFNAAFPLEAYQIAVDDYLLVPISPAEMVRCLGQTLKKVAAIKRAKTLVRERKIRPSAKYASQIMGAFHDIRNGLASSAASLQLLKRGSYGTAEAKVKEKLKELSSNIKKSTALIDRFVREVSPPPNSSVFNNGQTVVLPRVDKPKTGDLMAQSEPD